MKKRNLKRLFALLTSLILMISTIGQALAANAESETGEVPLYETSIKDSTFGKIEIDRPDGLYAAGEIVKVQASATEGNQIKLVEIINADTKALLLSSEETDIKYTMPEANIVIDAVYENEAELEPEEEAVAETETDEKSYQKTFKAGEGGILRILDMDGNVMEELAGGEEKIYDYFSGSDAPAEVQVEAVADPGYQVSSYEIKWFVNGEPYAVSESQHDINATSYERGHYLASAEWDETFEATFQPEGTRLQNAAFTMSARAAANIDNPQAGDVYTGGAYVVYDGYPNKTYNGTGYIVATSGDFTGDSIVMSTCASGHNYWAPQTGQTGTYTITITSVDTSTGLVICSVYWENDMNYAYQNLSGTYEYFHDFEGGLSVFKGMSDSLSAFIYPYGFSSNLDLRATFGIYSDSEAKNKVAEVKTDKSGKPIKAEVSLEAGTYYIKELVPPTGFALNESIKKIVIGAGASKSVTIKDRVLRAKVNGVKKDALTGETKPSDGLSLEGAEYSVYGNSACTNYITKGVTDEDGKIEFDCIYFAYGTFYIKETKAPEGYNLDTTVYKVVIDESLGFYKESTYRLNDMEFVSEDPPKTGKGKVKKISANPGISAGNSCYSLEGAEFKLTRVATGKEVSERLVTNASGETQEITLLIGKYTVEEVKAPKGFERSTEVVTIEVKEGQTAVCTFDNEPASDPVAVLLQKRDADTGKTVPTGSGVFENAEYLFCYYDGYYSSEAELAGKTPLRSWVLATDQRGGIQFRTAKKISGNNFYLREDGTRTIPLGTVTIKETKAPEGYKLDPELHIRNITAETGTGNIIQSYQTPESPEPIIRGGVQLEKWDYELDERNSQGEAVLRVATIQIINKSKNAVMVEGVLYEPGEVVKTVTTDENGIYRSAADLLPYGEYEAVEVSPPEGYLPTGKLREYFEIREEGKIEELTDKRAIKNDPIRGGVQIEKWDNEIQSNKAQGGATFEGTVVQIINRSIKAVLVEDVLYEPGEVVKTVTTDKDGIYRSADDLLPYGNYEAVEVSPPEGYLATGKLQEYFEIRENGAIVVLTEERAIKNDPKRGDLKGVKISDGDMKRMAGIPFRITSVTTGESHVVVTDDNGQFNTSSEWNPHSQNTNRGETYEDGVWFGEIDTLDDSKGALLYDTYLIEELPCEGNEDRVTLEPFVITIKRHMVTIDLGTITNDYKPMPEIGTTATDKETGEHYGFAGEETTIIDVVSYKNLTPGQEYTVEGTLMDKETGEPLLEDGVEITAMETFIPEDTEGSVELAFTFNSSALIGKAVVVFERMYYGGKEVAAHADIEDGGQTVEFKEPEIGTTATDKETGEHIGFVREETTIVDVVRYRDLIPGKEYTVKGILMDKERGEPLLAGDEEITAEKTFTAQEANGNIEIEFTFDSTTLRGKAAVVFESLFYGEREIAVHADIEDAGQTVEYGEPEIGTTATDKETGEHIGFAGEKTTIIDVVEYNNLIPGKEYVVKGILMDKETGEPLLVDDEEITAEKAFTALEANGSVEIEFTFDSTALKGKAAVVFESLYYEEREIAVHADIEDDSQTVEYEEPEIGTTATDKETGEHVGFVNEKSTIVDVIEYKNLILGKEYVVKGILMDKETGEPLLVVDEQITAEKAFIALEANGSVELTFTFDSTALKGKAIVVFESMYYGEREIAVHADIEDDNQTVEYEKPEIGTTATDKETGEHSGFVNEKTTIIDVVEYKNLIPGKKYVVKGVLMDKETGKALLANGKEITAEKTFKAKKSSGSVKLKFAFDSRALLGKAIVAFESVYYEKREIAVHADIEDDSQSVEFKNPEIGTSASEKNTGNKEITASGEVTIADIVKYKNLIPGKKYTLKGVLMDKETGKPLLVNGKEITAEKTFVAEKADGSIEVEFTLASGSLKGKEAVVFETLYYGGREIAVHIDINDKGQTVKFVEPGTPDEPGTPNTPSTPKTGDETPVAVYIIMTAIGISILGYFLYKRKKKKCN